MAPVLFLLQLFILADFTWCQDAPPMAEIDDGSIIGRLAESWGGRTFASYESIPYAAPPLGQLRFMPPERVEPWGTLTPLDATGKPPICTQGDEGQEDCLYLNVYTGLYQGETEKLPVMVYIHGGGLKTGSSVTNPSPDFLMDYDIVLVTINYRLGSLGFLSLGNDEVTGNQGFRDQTKAFQWVQDNIEAFGGDPAQVTIFGESAGSWSVMYHILSPLAAGLFKQAIGQSGTPLGHLDKSYRTAEEAVQFGLKLAETAGCPPNDGTLLTQCMQTVPIEILRNIEYVPRGAIDGGVTAEPILPEAPENLLSRGDFNRVPLLLGTNSGEAVSYNEDILRQPSLLSVINNDWDEFYGPIYLRERTGDGDITQKDIEICRAAREYFFAPSGVIELDKLDKFIDMHTDALFLYGVHLMGGAVAQFVPVYQYRLSYEGTFSFVNTTGLDTYGFDLGVAHADDLDYFFKRKPDSAFQDWTELDELTRMRLDEMWTNFAATGNPTPDGAQSNIVDVNWTPIEASGDRRYLDVGTSLVMTTNQYYTDRMNFWDSIVP